MNRIKDNSPEKLMPDNATFFIKDGKQIRKGTMASAITNVEIIESSKTTEHEKNNAINMLKELAPLLCAFGLGKHFIWKNPLIQHTFDDENIKEDKK
ncbi:MAG: hypothetical protein K0R14_53 [Burkholderiales bacterium]|jgi:hypothetical protein|nr:hypothetical protein [Burkholderiales bacterium]